MTHAPISPGRGSWGTRAGFILAAVGCAVGLGNMWRFSYVAAEGGGAAFVLIYLVFVAFIGIPLMTSEMVVGRMTKVSPVIALQQLGGSRWVPLGLLFVFCGVGILSFYSVIAGWTIRFSIDAVRGAIPADTGAYFQSVATGPPAIAMHLLFMAMTIGIVMAGVKKGLERTAYILMPLMVVLLIGLAVWAGTLSGSGAGYSYYLRPQLRELVNPEIISLAAGQAFFSLSLGMGALMTFASYLTTEENLGLESATVALSDFGVAFVSGLVVFPIVFHFNLASTIGLGGGITDNTAGTLFIAMPAAVQTLGPFGNLVISAFFVMLFFAAITSAISLLEVVASAAIDGLGWSRVKASLIGGVAIAVLGIPSAFDLNFLNVVDKFVGNFLLVLGGLLTCVLVGYRVLPEADAELAKGLSNEGPRRAWAGFVRYVAPPVLLFVLVFTFLAVIDAFQQLVGS